MSNVAESGEEHSIIWGMFMATTLHAATFIGKRISQLFKVLSRTMKVLHFETDVRCHSTIGEQSGRNQLHGQNSVVKEVLDTYVIN